MVVIEIAKVFVINSLTLFVPNPDLYNGGAKG